VQWYGRNDLFDIATTSDEFVYKIENYLNNPTPSPGRLGACRLEFDKLVSPLDGGTVGAYTKCIIDTIEERRGHFKPKPEIA